MPIPTPFHDKILPLCNSLNFKEWAGYYSVCSYDTHHDPEYFAFRHGAGMIDVTPLFKYDIEGPQAGDFLAYLTVKDVRKLKVDQVTYLCWCDDDGKMVDDGTVTRLSESLFRITSALPMFSWFQRYALGFKVEIKEVSQDLAVLSLQGPNSRDVLTAASDADMNSLKFFRGTSAKMDDIEVYITRTGYTGDLGFEVWTPKKNASRLWDILLEKGHPFGLLPCGLDAMDVTRVEAGFVLNGVDYFSALHCIIDSRKSSPYEVGLGWTVQLDRAPFVGQDALKKEKAEGSKWNFCGLVMDYDELEGLYAKHDLPPQICNHAWRDAVPIYDLNGTQIGYANSGTWSPTLKQNLALATLEAPYGQIGDRVKMEVTVEFTRQQVSCTVVPTPFFNPERKRFTPSVQK